MTGYYLRFIIWVLDQPWSLPLWNMFLRKSGVPQVTRELIIPDPTTFMPLWALPIAVPPTHKVLSGQVKERLEAAAASIPGTLCKKRMPSCPSIEAQDIQPRIVLTTLAS